MDFYKIDSINSLNEPSYRLGQLKDSLASDGNFYSSDFGQYENV